MTAPVMIMAGGTGGHIFPALAVARQLENRSVPVVWLGSRGGMETRIVPEQGIPMVEISVSGLRGKGLFTKLLAPFKLSLAVAQAIAAQIRYRPQAVLGLGGFASGPGGLAAWLLRRPLFIHEQNSIPGMTNRLLARLARCVMEGFPRAFDRAATKAPVVHVGNPVREDILQLNSSRLRLSERKGPVRILVFGGSLGAKTLNEQVPVALAQLEQPLEIRHQTGENKLQATAELYQELGLNVAPEAFIQDMAAAYAWADLVIARAGALTVTEIAQAGVASILVPYPYAVDDHQTANAQHLVSLGAAQVIADNAVNPETLQELLRPLIANRATLIEMGEQAHRLARPDAAATVAAICLGEINGSELSQTTGGEQ